MGKFFKTIDTILWGSKTYDKGIEMGMKSADLGEGTKNYLFFAVLGSDCFRDLEWTSKAVKPFAKQLRAETGKDIWMMGGGGLIASFLDEGEIDEFIIQLSRNRISPCAEWNKISVISHARSHNYQDGCKQKRTGPVPARRSMCLRCMA